MTSDAFKNFLKHFFEYILGMKNVLQDQSYPMKRKSNLYDTFKERYSHKREETVNFDDFVTLLTIFGAI